MEVTLINRAGIKKECPTGFSGTTLFFGFLVPLVRGDFVGMIIHILVTLVSVGFAWFIWPFFYNKNYINRLLEKGYMPYSEDDVSRLREMGISVDLTYEPPRKTEEEKVQTRIPMPESAVQKPVEPVADDRAANTFDLSTMISLSWPVELESGSLLKSDGANSRETLSCSFEIKNVQSRKILYTQWQLECFDILKKPIFTEIPVIVRHELNFGPEETVVVALSEGLPPGTRSFTPHLKAVLYADQTVDEFADDEVLISWKPRTKIADIEGFSESALSYYQQRHNLKERPKFLHEKIEEFIWTCAFCGTRNQASARKCRLCSTVIAQQELCTREKIEQSFVEHKVQQEQIAEENRKKLEEDERKRLQEEERRKAEEAKKAQENYESKKLEREKNKARLKKLTLIALVLLVVCGIALLIWHTVFKEPYLYDRAGKLVESGKYYKGYEMYGSLGDFSDSKDQSFDAYIRFLELESSAQLRINGYQWLLDNGYEREKAYDSFAKVLAMTELAEDRLAGWRWLDSKGYVKAKESLYKLANEMVGEGRFYEGYELYVSLRDYEDSQEIARGLATMQVTLDPQGGTGGSIAVPVVYGSAMPSAAAPQRKGYIFEGYYDQVNGGGTQYYTRAMGSARNWDRMPAATLYAKWKVPSVGELGPAGGYVFYDKGSYSDGWRYMEAAPASIEWGDKVWGGYGRRVGYTATGIGKGKDNTEKIVSKFGYAEPYGKQTDYAAKLCSDLKLTKDGVVYDDWFLPSKDELDQMYSNLHKKGIGGFSDAYYWSSSEYSANDAWSQNFNNGYQLDNYRDNNYRVRPVRAF